MKAKKKVLSILMALAMALCLSPASAFAATVTVDPLTPYGASGDTTDYLDGHTFNLYQIFTGNNSTGKILTDIQWGNAIVNGSTYDYGTVDATTSTASNNLLLYLANLTYTDENNQVSKALPGLSSGGSAGSVSASHLAITTAAELAKYLADSTVMTDGKVAIVVEGIEDFIALHPDITVTASITGTATSTSVDAGYYLVVDATAIAEGTTDALNKTLLQVVGDNDDLHIQAKTAIPTINKDIWEDRGRSATDTFPAGTTAGNKSSWSLDTATGQNTYEEGDYEIGQKIPFRLTSAIPDMSEFDTYKYIIRDSMSDGLTLDASSFKVSIFDSTSTVKYVLSSSEYELKTADDEGTTGYVEDFYIKIADLKSVLASAIAAQNDGTLTPSKTRDSGWQLVVEYTAALNENAIVGNNGNPNEVYLEYSNNPNNSGGGDSDDTGTTPKDTVWAFTYGADVNKIATVDGVKTALTDAEFVLYKTVDGTNYFAKTTEVTKTDSNGYPIYAATDGDTTTYYALINGSYYLYENGTTSGTAASPAPTGVTEVKTNKITSWVAESECVTASGSTTTYDRTKITVFTGSTFEFDGLDENDSYYLREIKAPSGGYNLLTDDIRLVFTATIAEVDTDGDSIKDAQRITDLSLATYKRGSDSKFAEATANANTGHGTFDVENNKGAALPETGALGTTMMVIVGAGIACAAAVLMITRKKMSAYQD